MKTRPKQNTRRAGPRQVILLNKPYGVLSQFTDKGNQDTPRATLSDHVDLPGIYPAGRLDRDSEGLLILTNDGKLQARLSNPRYKQPKTYLVQVEGAPTPEQINALCSGVLLKDGATRPARCELIPAPTIWERSPPVRFRKSVPDAWLSLTLTEGRNRQVRRMCAHVGLPCLRLIRWSIGSHDLTGLAPGEWRSL